MKRMLLLTLLVACGDNGKAVNTDPDASGNDTISFPARAVVVAGDFVTPGFSGVMSRLDVGAMTVTQNVAPAGSIGNDPIIRKIGDELFVVNRAGGNNVTIFDANTLTVKEQLATGAGSNPQDVATYAKKLYVPADGTAGVVVLERGSTTIKTISLASLDPDGQPNCVSAIRAGNDIYVACGLLDPGTFAPRGPGRVAVIDATSDTVRATVTLSTANPFGTFTELPGTMGIVIPTFDFLAPTTRCLERVTPGLSPLANGCLIQHAELGGYVVRSAVQRLGETDMLWMVVNNGDFSPPTDERVRLWGYDLTSLTLWTPAITPEAQILSDVAPCPNGEVVVADKTMAANGLRVYDGTSTMEKTTMPLPIGLRPQSAPAIVCY
jgi:hypothetical protein